MLDVVCVVWLVECFFSVRIFASDWVEGGTIGDDVVAIACVLKVHGCDIVDVFMG